MNSLSTHERVRQIVTQERERLYAILEDDASQAIVEARRLIRRPDLSDANIDGLRASIFIDAGERIADASVILEGIALLREGDSSETPECLYNIGNGLAALARIQRTGLPGELGTAELRRDARGLFQEAAERSAEAFVRSSSFTNQANLLKDSFRWLEAYDSYVNALTNDAANAIALSGIGNLLQWRLKSRIDARGPLRRAAVRYLLRAHDSIEQARHYAGPRGVKRIEDLIRQFKIDLDAEREPEPPPASAYASFVRRHRLALCLTPESAGADLGRWDHLAIRSITEPINADDGVPTIVATWNILKSDFLTARWLVYVATNHDIPETGFYSDTLDYANYGVGPSALVLAQKASFDILDKIAVAATGYFHLHGDPQRVYFASRWHVMDAKQQRRAASPLRWQAEIEAEIKSGNSNLIALAELAQDYADGYLRSKKQVRNSATHRFIVLHEMLIESGCRRAAELERYTEAEFECLAIESLQLVRAALLYFHGAISFRERRLERESACRIGELKVPAHHDIRGD